jgi:hypothetical protein
VATAYFNSNSILLDPGVAFGDTSTFRVIVHVPAGVKPFTHVPEISFIFTSLGAVALN